MSKTIDEKTLKQILEKRVDELTPEEKAILREWFIRHRSKHSLASDLARASKKTPVYTATWYTRPGRYDIPGVDTPQALPQYQKLGYKPKHKKKKELKPLLKEYLGGKTKFGRISFDIVREGDKQYLVMYDNNEPVVKTEIQYPNSIEIHALAGINNALMDLVKKAREKGYVIDYKIEGIRESKPHITDVVIAKIHDDSMWILYPEDSIYYWFDPGRFIKNYMIEHSYLVQVFKEEANKHGYHYPLEVLGATEKIYENKSPYIAVYEGYNEEGKKGYYIYTKTRGKWGARGTHIVFGPSWDEAVKKALSEGALSPKMMDIIFNLSGRTLPAFNDARIYSLLNIYEILGKDTVLKEAIIGIEPNKEIKAYMDADRTLLVYPYNYDYEANKLMESFKFDKIMILPKFYVAIEEEYGDDLSNALKKAGITFEKYKNYVLIPIEEFSMSKIRKIFPRIKYYNIYGAVKDQMDHARGIGIYPYLWKLVRRKQPYRVYADANNIGDNPVILDYPGTIIVIAPHIL